MAGTTLVISIGAVKVYRVAGDAFIVADQGGFLDGSFGTVREALAAADVKLPAPPTTEKRE